METAILTNNEILTVLKTYVDMMNKHISEPEKLAEGSIMDFTNVEFNGEIISLFPFMGLCSNFREIPLDILSNFREYCKEHNINIHIRGGKHSILLYKV